MRLKLRLICISTLALLAFTPTSAQTSAEIEARYGTPIKVYEVRPGYQMEVEYAANGQAAEFRVERHHTSKSGASVDPFIPPEAAKEIVDELAPASRRGEKGKFFGLQIIVGGSGTSGEEYENVVITYYWNHSRAKEGAGIIGFVIRWKNR